MRVWNTLPMRDTVLVRGSGCKVYDVDGRVYLDLQSGYWCNVLGYGYPALTEPVGEQITRLTNVMSSFMRTEGMAEEPLRKRSTS